MIDSKTDCPPRALKSIATLYLIVVDDDMRKRLLVHMSTTKKNSRSRANEDPDIALSKKLSYVLRHGAEKSGIPIQSNGYVKLDDLVRIRSLINLFNRRLETTSEL